MILQKAYRSHLARSLVRMKYIVSYVATLRLQAMVRGFKGRMRALIRRREVEWAVGVIARCYRGHVTRKHIQELLAMGRRRRIQQRQGATCIQALARMRQKHKKYVLLCDVTIKLQRQFRFRRYLAAQKMQSMIRGVLARRAIKKLRYMYHTAARKIQQSWRRHECLCNLHKVHQEAAAIQKVFRGFTSRRLSQGWMRSKLKSTRTIQRWLGRRIFRREIARRKYIRAAVRIQNVIRRQQAMKRYRHIRHLICRCQSRAKVPRTVRKREKKEHRFSERVFEYCQQFEELAKVAQMDHLLGMNVGTPPHPDRERNRFIKHLHRFHRPLRACFLKYATRGVGEAAELTFQVSLRNFVALCVDVGVVHGTPQRSPSPASPSKSPKPSRSSAMTDSEIAKQAQEKAAHKEADEDGDEGEGEEEEEEPVGFPKQLTEAEVEEIFQLALIPLDPNAPRAIQDRGIPPVRTKECVLGELCADEFVDAIVRVALKAFQDYADTGAAERGYQSNSFRLLCFLRRAFGSMLSIQESQIFGDDGQLRAMLPPEEVSPPTPAQNALAMYEAKMRKAHILFATPRKGQPISMSFGDFGLLMKANKGYHKKHLSQAAILQAFIASNIEEITLFLEDLPQIGRFTDMLWLEYPEFEEALCRCALKKAYSVDSKSTEETVVKTLGDLCRLTCKVKHKTRDSFMANSF